MLVFHCFLRDDEEKKKSHSDGTDEKDNGSQTKAVSRIGNSNNPFLDIPHDPSAAVYKTGFLARKIHADMDGKKSAYISLLMFHFVTSAQCLLGWAPVLLKANCAASLGEITAITNNTAIGLSRSHC